MLVAAGMIAADINLETPRDVQLQSEAFGAMLKDMAKADRVAGDAGEPRFLDLIGAGIAPESSRKAPIRSASIRGAITPPGASLTLRRLLPSPTADELAD